MKSISLNFNKRVIVYGKHCENKAVVAELFDILGLKGKFAGNDGQFLDMTHESDCADGILFFLGDAPEELVFFRKLAAQSGMKIIAVADENISDNGLDEISEFTDNIIRGSLQLGKLRAVVEKCWGTEKRSV